MTVTAPMDVVAAEARRDATDAMNDVDPRSFWLLVHSETWDDWATLAKRALDTDHPLHVQLTNGVAVSVGAPDARWTFWPPRHDDRLPVGLAALVIALADRWTS